jgi:hypothetical protein
VACSNRDSNLHSPPNTTMYNASIQGGSPCQIVGIVVFVAVKCLFLVDKITKLVKSIFLHSI